MLSMFVLSDRTAVLEIMCCCVNVWYIQCCPVSTWCSLREAVLLPHMLPMTMGCCGNLASKWIILLILLLCCSVLIHSSPNLWNKCCKIIFARLTPLCLSTTLSLLLWSFRLEILVECSTLIPCWALGATQPDQNCDSAPFQEKGALQHSLRKCSVKICAQWVYNGGTTAVHWNISQIKQCIVFHSTALQCTSGAQCIKFYWARLVVCMIFCITLQ